MKALLKSIEKNINSIESGHADVKVFDETIRDVQGLLEKLYIIRYKAYLGSEHLPSAVIESTPTTQVTVEESTLSFDLTSEPLDLQGSIEQTISLDKAEEDLNETIVTEALPQENTLPEPALDAQVPALVPVENVESPMDSLFDSLEPLKISDEEKEAPLDIPSEPTLENLFDLAQDTSSSIAFNLSEIIAHTPQGEAIETLIGCFSLKEKLQCINHLFDGSSEIFAFSIKKLDECPAMDEAESNLIYLSNKHNWKEKDVAAVQVLIEKVKCRYA